MDRSSLIDIVKRNKPITEEAPNTSTDRSTRHSPGRTLHGVLYLRACPRHPRLAQVYRPLTALIFASRGLSLSKLRPGSHDYFRTIKPFFALSECQCLKCPLCRP